MATPRNRWFKCYIEDLLAGGGDDTTRLVILRLRALLTLLWSEDQPDSERGRVTLTSKTLHQVTGKRHVDSGLAALASACRLHGISLAYAVERHGKSQANAGDMPTIFWPNYAEYKSVDARELPARRPRKARSVEVAVALSQERTLEREPIAASAAPAPVVELEQLSLVAERKPPVRKSGRQPRAKTAAPERFTDEQRLLIRVWAKTDEPWALPQLLALEAACLDFFRSEGKLKVDWLATFRGWIRREAKFAGAPQRTALQAIRGGRAQPGDPDGIWDEALIPGRDA